jgi:hypothetical protein
MGREAPGVSGSGKEVRPGQTGRIEKRLRFAKRTGGKNTMSMYPASAAWSSAYYATRILLLNGYKAKEINSVMLSRKALRLN